MTTEKNSKDAIATNIENLITPYLKRLKMSPLSSTQRALVEVVESHLRELTSKFLRSIVPRLQDPDTSRNADRSSGKRREDYEGNSRSAVHLGKNSLISQG